MKPASRRDLLLMMAAAGALLARGGEQRELLPVNTPGIDHWLLRTVLHAQPFRGGQRYFVLQVSRSYS